MSNKNNVNIYPDIYDKLYKNEKQSVFFNILLYIGLIICIIILISLLFNLSPEDTSELLKLDHEFRGDTSQNTVLSGSSNSEKDIISRNIWINPTDSYLIINDKLRVTKNHIIHFKRDNQHYFRFADHLTIGDELMNDKEVYESVKDIKEIHEKTNVYNFELDKDNTYFAENYLVHHYCELCSGYSNIL